MVLMSLKPSVTGLIMACMMALHVQADSIEQEYNKFKFQNRSEITLENGKNYRFEVLSRKKAGNIEIVTAQLEDANWADLKPCNLVVTLNDRSKTIQGIADISEGHFKTRKDAATGTMAWVKDERPSVIDDLPIVRSLAGSRKARSMAPATVNGEKDANGNYVIDVFLGFSDRAAAYVGDIEATAHLYVESVNAGLKNSQVKGTYLRLVGVGQVPHNPGIVTSVLDDVKVWFKADIARLAPDLIGMVQMPTGAPNEAAGWAGVTGDTQVVGAPWPDAWRHEVGHNVGGIHCKEVGDTGYNYGYSIREGRGTIMCGNDIPYYSTPLVRDDEGHVIGSAEDQDMARVWRERMAEMAANRIHTVPYETAGDNLARSRPVMVSSVEDEQASLAGSQAVDGQADTRWSSRFDDLQWITVDLGQTCAIQRVVLNWEAAYGKDYEIRVSDDNRTWRVLYASNQGGHGGVESLTVSGQGRYVQMHGKTRGTPYGFSLWEFEVYGSAKPLYLIKNRWLNAYLYDGGDQLKYGSSAADQTYRWSMEELGNGQKEIRNVGTGDHIHIENRQAWAQCMPRTAGWWSSRWVLEDEGSGYVFFRNVWQGSSYLHVENQKGYVQQGRIGSKGWWSAQWQLIPAP